MLRSPGIRQVFAKRLVERGTGWIPCRAAVGGVNISGAETWAGSRGRRGGWGCRAGLTPGRRRSRKYCEMSGSRAVALDYEQERSAAAVLWPLSESSSRGVRATIF